MRVMAFGTYDTTVHPRVGILIEGLLRHGIEVVTCNVPLGHMDAGPVVPPPPVHPGVPRQRMRHARCLAELAAKARRAPRPDVVICGYQGRLDIQMARRLFPHTPLVLDHLESVDDAADRTGRAEGTGRRANRLEQAAIGRADLVIVDTEEHRRMLAEGDRARTVVVPIGASPVWFDAGRGVGDGGPASTEAPRTAGSVEQPADLRVIAFGMYSPVQGAPVIGAALAQLDGYPIRVTMVGRGLEARRTRELVGADRSWVDWREWVPEDELPGLVSRHDVCLGVFGTGPKALRVVPNKVFQGAAAGCAVVTSDTAPQRRLFGSAALFVPPGEPDPLADALRRLAQHPAEVARLRAAAVTAARARFGAQTVVEPLLERLEAIAGKGS